MLLPGLGAPRGPAAARSGGAPHVRGPDRLRANPAQLFEALERARNDLGLREPGPLLAVHLARGERAEGVSDWMALC